MDRVRDDNAFAPDTRLPQEPDEARAGDDPQATAATPDTGLIDAGDESAYNDGYTAEDLNMDTGEEGSGAGIQNDAAQDVNTDSGSVIDAPDTSNEPNAVDAVTYEGKKVFSPHELNQSGEDKEYFHPDKGHQFKAPKDANDHALTPDVEVTPDNKVKQIR